MKVALYARVSSDRQDVDLSISAQLRALREHASSNGYEVVREYVDEAESGRSAARPCFQRMIADSRRAGCPFKIILIWKYSRFARNREDSIVYKALLRRHGVQVVSITEPADDSPTGKLFEAIIESLDEFYSANLAQETLRGMRESASRGSYVAPTPPFGYRRVKITDRDRRRITLEPDPETAPVVRRIFRDAVHSNGLKEICQQLNREGIGRRGRAWTKNGLYRLLTNEAYTGVLVWGRASRNGHSVCPIRVEGAWEPLVDRDTFDQVRTTLRERSFAVIHPTRVSSRYLLSGIVRCGRCNTALIGQKAKSGGYSYYVCGTLLRQGAGSCDTPYLNSRRFEAFIVGKIKNYILTADNLKTLAYMVTQELGALHGDRDSRAERIEVDLAEIQRRLDRIYDALETGVASPDDLGERIRVLKARQDVLREARREAEAARGDRNQVLADMADVARHVDNLRDLLDHGSLAEQKTFIRKFVSDIVVRGGNVRVRYTMPVLPHQKYNERLPVPHVVQDGSPARTRT